MLRDGVAQQLPLECRCPPAAGDVHGDPVAGRVVRRFPQRLAQIRIEAGDGRDVVVDRGAVRDGTVIRTERAEPGADGGAVAVWGRPVQAALPPAGPGCGGGGGRRGRRHPDAEGAERCDGDECQDRANR
ncbi:hypothetical protein PSA01_63590 [Pseudonocardia saturnea]|uniref:Uncharacterized protein n=1 Tax=Pseudonocardia saturnea TaxID=33909 RepID=A0ABQ0S8T5_9PSEU|nr:hypothetical protein Pdca_06140 [Pseudonocardia autotrophica]GEC29330.1 hypothetical protein PSA01_63590 [Pseudonocardia saturnea]